MQLWAAAGSAGLQASTHAWRDTSVETGNMQAGHVTDAVTPCCINASGTQHHRHIQTQAWLYVHRHQTTHTAAFTVLLAVVAVTLPLLLLLLL